MGSFGADGICVGGGGQDPFCQQAVIAPEGATASEDTAQDPLSSLKSGPPVPLNLTLAAVDQSVLAVLNNIFGVAIGILDVAAKDIGLVSPPPSVRPAHHSVTDLPRSGISLQRSATISLMLSSVTMPAGMAQWYLSADAFDQTLEKDFGSSSSSSLSKADPMAQYFSMWKALETQIKAGEWMMRLCLCYSH